MQTSKIVLLGNPNCGKTTLFNKLTGLQQKTANYPGVTVDKHLGYTYLEKEGVKYKFEITDLPGTYSLYPKSIDEVVACKELLGINGKEPEVVVVVTDASSLKRHLLLATQVIDLKLPVVLVLNMIDEAKKEGLKIDIEELIRLLGVEVIAVNSRTGEGLKELKEKLLIAKESINQFIEPERIKEFSSDLKSFRSIIQSQFEPGLKNSDKLRAFEEKESVHRFNLVNYVFARGVDTKDRITRKFSYKLDQVITHPVFGYVFLLAVLFIIFQFIFSVAEYPMQWIESFFSNLMQQTSGYLPKGELSNLLVNGILSGLSGIVIFIPQIALLFFFIGLLEDSGYMSRVSFIMDKIFRKFGLNGKSVVPIVSGVACAVPSVLGTRTISNLKERFITIFVIPLMSCSARLPVYTLLISLLVPNETYLGLFNLKGILLFTMYILGFVATMITALILKFLVKSKEKSFFVMELPVYRIPQLKSIGINVFNKVKIFLLEAGKIILAISVILWYLSSHGPANSFEEIERKQIALNEKKLNRNVAKEVKKLESEKLEASYVGILGKAIEPAIKPLGFDWKIGIALITSFAAREVFVGTMSTIYSANDSENLLSIREKLITEKNPHTLEPMYTTGVCVSLLVFYAFALQCMSTIAVVYRETKSWFWTVSQFIYMTALAYICSAIAYHLF